MPDVVLLSGWRWETFNTPERIALALSSAGARVLYCQNPASYWKNSSAPVSEISPGVFGYNPLFFGHRLNNFRLLARIQCKSLARQILAQAADLSFQNPSVIYPHLKSLTPLLHEIKSRGFRLVHLCIDAPEPYQWEQIELSDITLTIPPTIHDLLNRRYPGKSHLIPQPFHFAPPASSPPPEPDFLSAIPRPRLAYLGPAFERLDVSLIEAVFRANPGWHFLTFGGTRCSALPNVHCIRWCDWRDIPRIVQHIDVGFMPYNCSLESARHCVPLKLFDYFAVGLPVVSTPILYAQRLPELLYLADTSETVARALGAALNEPADSSTRLQRRNFVTAHSIPRVAQTLRDILYPSQAESAAPSSTDRTLPAASPSRALGAPR